MLYLKSVSNHNLSIPMVYTFGHPTGQACGLRFGLEPVRSKSLGVAQTIHYTYHNIYKTDTIRTWENTPKPTNNHQKIVTFICWSIKSSRNNFTYFLFIFELSYKNFCGFFSLNGLPMPRLNHAHRGHLGCAE